MQKQWKKWSQRNVGHMHRERTDAEAEAPILGPPDMKRWLIRKDPDAGKDSGQEEKGNIGWDSWMKSPIHWTWVWANSGRWWGTGKPGMLQSMGSQRVGHDWVTEKQWMHHGNTRKGENLEKEPEEYLKKWRPKLAKFEMKNTYIHFQEV